MRRSACALAFAMFMAGCANFPQFNPGSAPAEAPQRAPDAKALEKELSAVKERNALLEAQVAESTGKIERLTGEIRELKMIGSNLGATVERLRRESIMAKSFPAPPPPRRPARTPEPAPGKPAAAPKKPGRASVAPQALYNKSYRAVRDGKNEAAIRGFRLFLRLFPKSQLAAHSQYWLGEAY